MPPVTSGAAEPCSVPAREAKLSGVMRGQKAGSLGIIRPDAFFDAGQQDARRLECLGEVGKTALRWREWSASFCIEDHVAENERNQPMISGRAGSKPYPRCGCGQRWPAPWPRGGRPARAARRPARRPTRSVEFPGVLPDFHEAPPFFRRVNALAGAISFELLVTKRA